MTENIEVVSREGGKFSAASSTDNATGILATARSKTGGSVGMRDVRGDDIVKVRGIDVTVDEAVHLGIVAKTGDGYTDVDPADAKKAADKANEAPKEDEPDLSNALAVDDDTDASLKDLAGALDAQGINSAGVVGALLSNPTALPEQIKMIAAKAGIDEGSAMEHVRGVAVKVEEAVTDYVVEEGGVDPAKLGDFWEYVHAHHSGKLAGAVIQALYMGDASPFLKFAEDFNRSAGRGRGDAASVGVNKVGVREVETMNIPGIGDVQLEAARRLRIV